MLKSAVFLRIFDVGFGFLDVRRNVPRLLLNPFKAKSLDDNADYHLAQQRCQYFPRDQARRGALLRDMIG